MTPAQYRKGAPEVNIRYTVARCRLGYLLLGATERGICAIRIGDSERALEGELLHEFPKAEKRRDQGELDRWLADVLRRVDGQEGDPRLPLDIRVSVFQRRVYNELQRIPRGQTRSYAEVARRLNMPRAARAVARACATNPVAVVVPCHRVVRGNGELGGYRWGIKNKQKLLAAESGD
jgi:AraC family transcriptional regulator of adaptative response/methylated-DNA-[protein]-cysteine methyltransferase